MRKRIHDRASDLKERDAWTKDAEKEIRLEEALLLQRQWKILLDTPGVSGERTRTAIIPMLQEWMERRHGSMTFRIAQLATGHDCFGSYVHRVGKKRDASCLHCEEEIDSMEHTLQNCPAWAEKRTLLVEKLEIEELTLGTIMVAILESREKWRAFAQFAKEVMRSKEEQERRRQRAERLSPSPDRDDFSS